MIRETILMATIFLLGMFIGGLAELTPVMDKATEILRKESYIAYVNTPTHGKDYTKLTLDNFNEMSYNHNIVRGEGLRPIFIIEKDLNEDGFLDIDFSLVILGMAYSSLFYCIITMQKDVVKDVYHDTLLHEYLHCHNIKHVCRRCNNLMSAVHVYDSDEEHIKHSADIIGAMNEQ